jgi:hypothetical protein
VVLNCKESGCLACRNSQNPRALRKAQWTLLDEITPNAVSYVIMVAMAIVYDISALLFSLNDFEKASMAFPMLLPV